MPSFQQHTNMNFDNCNINAFDYPLPDNRIAKYPLKERDKSKLLIYKHGKITDSRFCDIADHLSEDHLMVFNNTKVIQARLYFRKSTGALIEIFLLEPHLPHDYEQMFASRSSCEWICLVGNLKKWKTGTLEQQILIDGRNIVLQASRIDHKDGEQTIAFEWSADDVTFSEILDHCGELPIPPYLNRKTEASDNTTYQTVYSKIKGSVAAPTAGLHFTDAVLQSLNVKGIERAELTLHVGAGTFKPVKSETIANHEMHTEYITVPLNIVEALIRHKGKAIAVGTTSVRTIESLYYIGNKIANNPQIDEHQLGVSQWEPYNEDNVKPTSADQPLKNLICLAEYMKRNNLESLNSSTQIIIAPGYEYKYVKQLITNFHQPKSTLLLLVSAFIGNDWQKVYQHALCNDYRFLSYGDSSLLIP